MDGLLSGIRVLALENYLAGPFGSMILGDLGAEVIKIEPPAGDRSRESGKPELNGESHHYLAYNRNKKGIVLDLQTPSGKKAFFDLVKVSDVVWDNFRAGAMKRLGADYNSLARINPKIVTCSVSGFGPTGPFKDRQSVDAIAQGMSGIMSITGEPGRRPVRCGPYVSDMVGALYAVTGLTSALLKRERTGKGLEVQVSLFGASVTLMSVFLTLYMMNGEITQPMGSGAIHSVPYGALKTKDGYIVVGPSWPRIARVVGADWMIDDPNYSNMEWRIAHKDEVTARLEEYMQALTSEEWLPIMYENDIPAGPLNTVDKVVTDPQVNELGLIIEVMHSLGGKLKLVGSPIMTESKPNYFSPPVLGQHTDEVLKDILHYSAAEIKQLKKEQQDNLAVSEAHTRKKK